MAGSTIDYSEKVRSISDRARINRRVENDLDILLTHRYFGDSPESIFSIFGRDLSRNNIQIKKYVIDYIEENQDYFEHVFNESLGKKGTDLSAWIRCLSNEHHRGDELSTYATSLLCNIHCAIFLKNEILTTYSNSDNDDTATIISNCSILVAYYGQDGFRQLVPRQQPLEKARMRQLLELSSISDIALNLTSDEIQTRSKSRLLSPIRTNKTPPNETPKTFLPSNSPEYPPIDDPLQFNDLPNIQSQEEVVKTKRKRRPSPVPNPYRKNNKKKSGMIKFTTYGIPKRIKKRHKQCPVKSCKQVFKRIREFNGHTKRCHNLRYVCTHCGKTYSIKASLDRHQYLHKKTPFKCDKCDKQFAFRPDLLDHRVSHRRKGYYHCMFPKCTSVYKRQQDLNRHSKQHRDKSYRCRPCNYHTKCERYYQEHMRKHSQPLRYNCKNCNERFSYRMQLKRHIDIKHPKSKD